jgi:hypothetical protein
MKCEIYLIEISTGKRELVYSDNNIFPKEEPREYLKPGFFLQYTYDTKDTSSFYLPEDCPHTYGYINQEYVTVINNYSIGNITKLPIPLDEYLWNVKTEEDAMSDSTFYFECFQCEEIIPLQLNDIDEIIVKDDDTSA